MRSLISPTAVLLVSAAFSFPQGAFAQEYSYRSGNQEMPHVDRGAKIRVRAAEAIDSREGNLANYRGFVIDEVRGSAGRLIIPAGSPVELKVRLLPYNDLRLDLVWINIAGEQYMVQTDPLYVQAQNAVNSTGGMIGALKSDRVGGSELHIPRDAIMTFMLEDPVVIGEPNLQYNLDRATS